MTACNTSPFLGSPSIFYHHQTEHFLAKTQRDLIRTEEQLSRRQDPLEYADIPGETSTFLSLKHSSLQLEKDARQLQSNQGWLNYYLETMDEIKDTILNIRLTYTRATTFNQAAYDELFLSNNGFFETMCRMVSSNFEGKFIFSGDATQRPPLSEDFLKDFRTMLTEASPSQTIKAPVEYCQDSLEYWTFDLDHNQTFTVPTKATDFAPVFQSLIDFSELYLAGGITPQKMETLIARLDIFLQDHDNTVEIAQALYKAEQSLDQGTNQRIKMEGMLDGITGLDMIKNTTKQTQLMSSIETTLSMIMAQYQMFSNLVHMANKVSGM
jgi:hypothetical protein